MRRWRGLKKLVHDAVEHTTGLVEETEESVARKTMRYLEPFGPVADAARAVDQVRRLSSMGVYATIHGVNRTVDQLGDAGLDALERVRPSEAGAPVPLRSDAKGSWPWVSDAALGAVNGVIGDYLSSRGNGLDLGLSFRRGGHLLDLDGEGPLDGVGEVGSELVVFVHGLSCTEWSWWLGAEDHWGDPSVSFGTLLERDLGLTSVYVRYNSGRHVSENGRMLAEGLERLVRRWPVELERVILIGHSMGGLVVRSACHLGQSAGHGWLDRLDRVFCLGTPHQGAPMEKLGNVITATLSLFDTPGAQIPARVFNLRSVGIKDLRYGYVADEEWAGRDPDALLEDNRRPIPLVAGVPHTFVASTLGDRDGHPAGLVLGDALVREPSASGLAVDFGAEVERLSFRGIAHLGLQIHPEVYEVIRERCAR